MPKHNPKNKKVEETPKSHHLHRSDRNRFFQDDKKQTDCPTQSVHVEVNIDQKDDCMTSCFAGLAKCFGRGS